MSKLLTGSINLSKMDKTKLFKSESSGHFFLNIAVWVNDEEDDYGNHASIQQQQSKEDREAGAPRIYLGNMKMMSSGGLVPAKEEEVKELF